MSKLRRTFRLFVSSTFSDLVAERSALQEQVFPRLRELAMAHGCRFQAIDLRWGVSEEAALDQQTMKICLGEIERCQQVSPRPNFLILLGDRFGWRPLPYAIPADEFEKLLPLVSAEEREKLLWPKEETEEGKGGRRPSGWYRRDDNAVPPAYLLQPRRKGTGYDEYATWQSEVEGPLVAALERAARQAGLDEGALVKYTLSATGQEIMRGAMQVADAQQHVFGFFRHIANMEEVRAALPNAPARDYLDKDATGRQDAEAHAKLEALKGDLRRRLGQNVREYRATWTGEGITTDHIGSLPENLAACEALLAEGYEPRTLCEAVYRGLGRVILSECEKLEEQTTLQLEVEAHDAFAKERRQHFVGRAEILGQIAGYLVGDNSQPLAVWGESGTGKTALMAEAIRWAQAAQPAAEIVYRLVGATPESSNGRALLESLCRQVTRAYHGDESALPLDYRALAREFPRRLALATLEKPLILFLDALDQLSVSDNARNLIWLPDELPPHVKLVVSTLPGECLETLQRRLPAASILSVPALGRQNGERLLQRWLGHVDRTLAAEQRGDVLVKFEASGGLPLYLKLAFEEAKHWHSYDGLPVLSTQEPGLARDIPGVIRDLFRRLELESNHGKRLVSHALGCLAAARNGLSEDELLDLLWCNEEVKKDFFRRSPNSPQQISALPVVIWARLYLDLEPYLALRKADGAELLGFYHRQVAEAAQAGYLPKERHAELAAYFDPQPLYLDKDGESPNLRKLSEMLYQQRQAESWSALRESVSDLDFVNAKCQAGMVFDLLAELEASEGAYPQTAVAQVRQALIQALPTIAERRELALQTIYNHLVWADKLSPDLEASLQAAYQALEIRPFWIRAAAQLPGARSQSTLNLSFESPSNLQSLAAERTTLAVTSDAGECEIYSLSTGALEDAHKIENTQRVVGIAHGEKPRRMAWLEADGSIHVEGASPTLKGRAGERRLLYPSRGGVLAALENNCLVAWNAGTPARPICEVPGPLVVMRICREDQSVLFVAGRLNPVVGLLHWENGAWAAQFVPYSGPPIVDADLDAGGEWVAFLRKDRSVQIVELKSGQPKAQLFYERQGALVTGNPSCCAWGVGKQSDVVYFCTQTGQIGAWQWLANSYRQCANGYELTGANSIEMLAALPAQAETFYSTAKSASFVTGSPSSESGRMHASQVLGCFVTAAARIVSAGLQDRRLCWSTADGLSPIAVRFIPDLAMIAPCHEPDPVLVADKLHMVWEQSADRDVTKGEIIQFHEPIAGAFEVAPQTAVVLEQNGRIQQVHLQSEQTKGLYPIDGRRKHLIMVPARPLGLCWSVCQSRTGDAEWSLLLQHADGQEEEIYRSRSPIRSIAVSEDGTKVCVAGDGVRVLQVHGKEWGVVGQSRLSCTHVAFVGRPDVLGMVFDGVPYLEIREAFGNLDRLAAIRLPDQASCLSARGNRMALGCDSGDVLSLCLSGREST